MIYCSGNTLQTRFVSFPSLHSILGSSWVLPLYKPLVTLGCSWKLHIVCSEPQNTSDPLKTLLWKSSSKSHIYLSVLTQNNNKSLKVRLGLCCIQICSSGSKRPFLTQQHYKGLWDLCLCPIPKNMMARNPILDTILVYQELRESVP